MTRDLPFEFAYRWQDMGLDIVVHPGGANRSDGEIARARHLRDLVAHLEQRDRDLEDFLSGIGSGSGAGIYCAYGRAFSSGNTLEAEATVDVALTARSTMAIIVAGHFAGQPGDDLAVHFYVDDPARLGWVIDSPEPVNLMAGTIATAVTRDPGVWPVTAIATAVGSPGNNSNAYVSLVIIVGDNTEDDCVTYNTST